MEQQLKRYDEAKEEFSHALKLDPTNGRAHTNMANLLKKQYKNYKEAAKHYQEAIQLDHKNPTRHFNYGMSKTNVHIFWFSFIFYFFTIVCLFVYCTCV